MGKAICDSEGNKSVPAWLLLYVVLGLADMGFTLVAFQYGVTEANPFLANAGLYGLFEFSKLCTTLLVVCAAFWLRRHAITETIMGFANTVMCCLVVYHVSSLCQIWLR